jgi:hypothetical protein
MMSDPRFRNTIAGAISLMAISGDVFAQDLAVLAEQARPSVVELLVSGPDPHNQFKQPSPGSAFVVHTDKILKRTFLFTAAHVVGAPSEWLQDNSGKVSGRTIRVRRQDDNETMKIITDKVAVIAEDQEKDVAVLAIAEESLPSLPVASSTHLRQNDLTSLMGFPAADERFISKLLHIRRLDFSNFRIELDGPADGGQSGGPVMDSAGRVVGIASENNDRQNPRFHRAAIVSVALDLLNRYLSQFARPQLAFAPSDAVPNLPGSPLKPSDQPVANKLQISRRTGQVTVQVRGTGGGELAQSRTAEQTLGDKPEARVEASGGEQSECDEASGRTRSEARAVASVQPFELAGIKMRFDLWAQGGHYRTAMTCIAGKPVGLSGNDTGATSVAEGKGEIAFQAAAVPFDLRIVWQDMPADSGVELIGPDGFVHSAVGISGAGERIMPLTKSGNWRIRVVARAEAKAAGGAGRAQIATQPLVFVEAR